jgi:excisionase family DNA binding protein
VLFYTVGEVCEIFRIRPATLPHWVKAGRLPSPVKFGQRSLFRASDIDRIVTDARPAQPA